MHFVENKSVLKLLKIDVCDVLIKITSPDSHFLKISVLNIEPTDSIINQIIGYVSEWFDLERDLKPFYEMADVDNLLKPLIKKYYGLRLIGINDLYEILGWAIIGQQINLRFAHTLKKRFVEAYGKSYFYEGKTYYHFPEPDIISYIDKEDLLKLQFSKRKAEYVIEAAKGIVSGKISKEKLINMDIESIIKELVSIHGIGNWTAHYTAMKCLHKPDSFPIDDIGLMNAIRNQLNLPAKPTKNEILKLSEKWVNWYSYATFYLWRTLI